jgi:transposase-like protein
VRGCPRARPKLSKKECSQIYSFAPNGFADTKMNGQILRITLADRERIVRQVLSGQTAKTVAENAGVCPLTVRKWLDRYRREGRGRADRSCGPERLRQNVGGFPRATQWISNARICHLADRADRSMRNYFLDRSLSFAGRLAASLKGSSASGGHACPRVMSGCRGSSLT